ncbi:hypothetical protein G5B40_01705 [Pikeienuella piscinae]|uniref:Uncharacterized protein n=1 Tax=Pikeienuella piscinae TaxID=2748098 RepID=A0A7L5BSH8_9RHOB|nr:hypothetical protein [Pikeienuella piscinae]QIE54270.1 hypothetical protein G5B40_01705 [Pikeienuella piscinae]
MNDLTRHRDESSLTARPVRVAASTQAELRDAKIPWSGPIQGMVEPRQ